VKVQNVKKLELPEVTDEFAQTLGNFENVAKLREAVKDQLTTQKKSEYDEDYMERVIDQLTSKATIKYPPQLLNDEIEHAVEHIKQDLAEQQLELDVYLKTLKKDKEKWLEEEIKPVAQKLSSVHFCWMKSPKWKISRLEMKNSTRNSTTWSSRCSSSRISKSCSVN